MEEQQRRAANAVYTPDIISTEPVHQSLTADGFLKHTVFPTLCECYFLTVAV